MLDSRRADLIEKLHGIVLRIAPKVGIEPLKQMAGPVVPAPFEVIRQGFELRNSFGKVGKAFVLHNSGTWTLPQAPLKTFGEVVDVRVGEIADMSDAECRALDPSLSFADLDSKIAIEPAN